MGRNIASVSWVDHLCFGAGDGRLATPEALARRLICWRDDLDAGAIHWRLLRRHVPGRFAAGRGLTHPTIARTRDITWTDLDLVPQLAHAAGLDAWLYVSLFDEGWPLPRPGARARSFHNAMHGRHVAWQSAFSRAHSEYAVVDSAGRRRQWGVLSLAYPAVRRHFVRRFISLLTGTQFDGLFVCLRSQSRPADFADQFGFNAPARREFTRRHGPIRPDSEAGLASWRHLLGEHLTRFLRELREGLMPLRRRLAVGAPRGDVLGPPLGNATLDWRGWLEEGTVDQLVIGQDSSRCPSMWHTLWPMHRGRGYLQDYRDGSGLPSLDDHVTDTYAPALRGAARLFVARQWHPRSAAAESRLLALPAVSGLVFSSFRFDNPARIARGNWRA